MSTTPAQAQQVRVGVGVFILESSTTATDPTNDNPRFLIGKRKGAHGAGTYALPGGHLEFGESFEQCAAREVVEETGLNVQGLRFLTATNDVMTAEARHYVTVFMVCERQDGDGEAKVMEPEKCEGWEWCSWKELGEMALQGDESKLFLPLIDLIRQRPEVLPAL